MNNSRNLLWGRQRQEQLGPNAGFGTIQIVSNRVSAISFTGSTTAGIDRAIEILRTDEHLEPTVLDYALIPVEEQFEDWGTWAGDVNPSTGEVSTSSLARYRTRYGHVIRKYELIEPGPGGFGMIDFIIDGGRRVKSRIKIRVGFV
ncbi:MAG: hypothetical protein F6J87_15810 [Spirulina sp. SIO3F2]|nr:hypothetical protein [Spirulina sp. SIO3F2]